MNTYFGGRFVGTTFMAEKKAGEDFQLNLGADRQVKVRREAVRDKLKETAWGFEERTRYGIGLQDHRGEPEGCTRADQGGGCSSGLEDGPH